MMRLLFTSERKDLVLRKLWAGLLMLALNLSVGGVGTLFLATNVAHAATLPFSESFSETSGNTVPGWTEVESNPAHAKISNDGERASSPTKEHVRLEGGASIANTLDTSGFESIHLKYYWRGLAANELSDTLEVYWKPATETTYILLTSHATNTAGWSSEVDFTLPPEADNTSIDIKFVGLVSAANEAFYVDDISVTGSIPVPDKTPPAITLLGASPATVEVGDIYTDPGATASDDTDGDLTEDIETVSTVDTSTVGTYTVTYSVSDSSGNDAEEVTRTVEVVDTTAPEIITEDDVNVEATDSDGAIVEYTLPTATDNYDESVEVVCEPASGSLFPVGETIVTCTATDTGGNSTETTFTIIVADLPLDTDGDDLPDDDQTCEVDCAPCTESCDVPPVLGCTDESALNFNPEATEDNGSCEFAEDETPPAPTPTPIPPPSSSGGSSTFVYWGCTNPLATNFNRLANTDDGSCVFSHDGGTIPPPASSSAPVGEVLGAATTSLEFPLPPACAANPYLRDYMKIGVKNDSEQVKLLQTFLNEQGISLPVTGIFGPLTKAAVKKFQKVHHNEIIKPWIDAGYDAQSMKEGTGNVFKTTKRFINMTKCKEAVIPMPELTLE